jgi:hypothetical protein
MSALGQEQIFVHVRFTQIADIARQQLDVCFVPQPDELRVNDSGGVLFDQPVLPSTELAGPEFAECNRTSVFARLLTAWGLPMRRVALDRHWSGRRLGLLISSTNGVASLGGRGSMHSAISGFYDMTRADVDYRTAIANCRSTIG